MTGPRGPRAARRSAAGRAPACPRLAGCRLAQQRGTARSSCSSCCTASRLDPTRGAGRCARCVRGERGVSVTTCGCAAGRGSAGYMGPCDAARPHQDHGSKPPCTNGRRGEVVHPQQRRGRTHPLPPGAQQSLYCWVAWPPGAAASRACRDEFGSQNMLQPAPMGLGMVHWHWIHYTCATSLCVVLIGLASRRRAPPPTTIALAMTQRTRPPCTSALRTRHGSGNTAIRRNGSARPARGPLQGSGPGACSPLTRGIQPCAAVRQY